MPALDPINKTIITLGPYCTDDRFEYRSYLLTLRDHHFLIDTPPLVNFEAWVSQIEQHIRVANIDYLIIQTINMTYCGVISLLVKRGFVGQVITTYLFGRPLLELHPDLKLQTIDELSHELRIETRPTLKFIPLSFLPFPQMFMTYAVLEAVLFSANIFGSLKINGEATDKILDQAVFDFHKITMPSSEYIKEPLRKITHLPLKAIYPSYGRDYQGDALIKALEREYRLDFYNTHQVIRYDAKGNKEFNYTEIANHVVITLLKDYSKSAVLDLLKDGPWAINEVTLELTMTTLTDYRFYESLFKHLYARGGSNLLVLLEPLVHVYQKQYGLKLPSIYTAQLVDIDKQKQALELEKQQLNQKIAELKYDLAKRDDSLLKENTLELYNENYFRKLMLSELVNNPLPPYTRGFLLVQIDQLQQLNDKYGKTTGDESLRHLKYHLSEVKQTDDVMIKLNGPYVLLYQKTTTPERLLALALKLRNIVNNSTLFIEKVTVSSSFLALNELKNDIVLEEKSRVILTELEKRLKFATRTGKAQIGQKTLPEDALVDGVILLIDEDDINRNMLTRIFKRINYQVVTVASVTEALPVLEQQAIDVIISEINLAKIDGFAFKQTLNEHPDLANTPFIMVSHSKTIANIRRANLLNVDLLLEKPIIPEELLGHVKRLRAKK